MLMEKLQQERLCIGVGSIASVPPLARRHDRLREGARAPSASRSRAFQNTQFKLAELATEVEIGQAFVDKLLAAHVRGEDIVTEVSMAKWWTTDLQKKVTAECLQLFGGYGFMSEYPISHGLRRRRGAVDLRRDQRDHEGDHLAPARAGLRRVAGFALQPWVPSVWSRLPMASSTVRRSSAK